MNRDSRKEKRLVWRQICQVRNTKKFKISNVIYISIAYNKHPDISFRK